MVVGQSFEYEGKGETTSIKKVVAVSRKLPDSLAKRAVPISDNDLVKAFNQALLNADIQKD